MEMFQYSEKKVRMGWPSPAPCAVSSRLSFSVGRTLPSPSRGPPAVSGRARPLGQYHHKDPWGRAPAPSHFSALLLTLLCRVMLTQPLLGNPILSPPALTLSQALPALPSSPREEDHGELGICLHHQSSSGGNGEPGKVELHEIQAGSVCQNADACRIAVSPLLRAVAVGGHLALSVRKGFIY